MTLIMATVVDNVAYIGSDRLGSNGYTKEIYKNHKIFLKDNILFGGAGSFRTLQLLEHSFDVPVMTQDVDTYVHTVFLPAIITLFRDNHVLTELNNFDSLKYSEFVFVIGGRLFKMQSDLSLLEPVDSVLCAGSGEDYALGVLKALKGFDLSVEDMFKRALKVASECVSSVGGRLHLIKHIVT